jgi:hypothetical protein
MTDDRPTTDPLVLAVTGALSEHGFVSNGADHYCGCGGVKFEVWPQWDAYCEHIAEVAVAALVPLIRAQAAEEQAAWDCDDPWTCCIHPRPTERTDRG